MYISNTFVIMAGYWLAVPGYYGRVWGSRAGPGPPVPGGPCGWPVGLGKVTGYRSRGKCPRLDTAETDLAGSVPGPR